MIHKQEINLNFLKSIKLNTWIRSKNVKIKYDHGMISLDVPITSRSNVRMTFADVGPWDLDVMQYYVSYSTKTNNRPQG